jgi:uncharacterized protein YkwD
MQSQELGAPRVADFRTRLRRLAACVLAFLSIAVPAGQALASPTTDVIDRINDLRRDHGLRTLQVSPSLVHSANAYADTMMDRQYFGHAGRIRASSRFERLGEILQIHVGRDPAPGWAFRDWLGSPPHLEVMLDPLFTYIGGGYTVGRFRGRTDTIWAVHFGRP